MDTDKSFVVQVQLRFIGCRRATPVSDAGTGIGHDDKMGRDHTKLRFFATADELTVAIIASQNHYHQQNGMVCSRKGVAHRFPSSPMLWRAPVVERIGPIASFSKSLSGPPAKSVTCWRSAHD
jgi:hypothetical protein